MDVLCFSHLRWLFVYQRPQHLLSRFGREGRVFYVEEPTYGDEGPWEPLGGKARLDLTTVEGGVTVLCPRLPDGISPDEADELQRGLVDELVESEGLRDYVLWYYTPAAVAFTRHLEPAATVYDVMDELSAFQVVPEGLLEREREVFERADLVFTGGRSLYEAKRDRHPDVHLFPSSVDVAHFAAAREPRDDPPDQAAIPRPRLGFHGVVDERMDLPLLEAVAAARPEWQLVLVGPVVKIDPATLPQAPNVHYLGGKGYDELPAYLGGWDVALLPFARNASTRFISPTKTPEYLAAGKPVVSTSIADVVTPFEALGLVRIADEPAAFVAAVEAALADDRAELLGRADAFLRETSWERTWEAMSRLIAERTFSAFQI